MAEWHPILAAEEPAPMRWVLRDPLGRSYGEVTAVRRGPEVGYRANGREGELVGYYLTLRGACRAVHERYLRAMTPGDPPPEMFHQRGLWTIPPKGTVS